MTKVGGVRLAAALLTNCDSSGSINNAGTKCKEGCKRNNLVFSCQKCNKLASWANF
jgi:hypothetical protein